MYPEAPSSSLKAILVYITITYLLSIILGVFIGFTGGHESPWIGVGFISMLFPAFAVLIASSVMNDGLYIDWDRLPLQYLPIALLLIPLILHAVMLPVTFAIEGELPWFDWLTPTSDGVYHTPESRGWGNLTIYGLIAHMVLNAVVGIIAVSILAFFEEIGWRAWLLPRLAERMDPRCAVIVTSVIAALWHLPYALSGIHYLDGISAVKTALFMPIGHIGAAMIIGWLWLRSESIWIVSLAHGALNNWGQYAFKFMDDPVIADAGRVLGSGMLALLVIGSLLLWYYPPPDVNNLGSPRLKLHGKKA